VLAERAVEFARLVDTVAPGASLPAGLLAVTADELLDLTAAAVEVLRLAEAVVAATAGEVARRSDPTLPDPLARVRGEKTPAALVAQATGMHESDATRFTTTGCALAPRAGLTGEVLPPFHEVLADAVAAGAVDVRAARLIGQTLDRIEPHATPAELLHAERALVTGATGEWSARTVQEVCRVLPDRFDPDGAEPRDAELRARRGLWRKVMPDGSVKLTVILDLESAAYLDARTAPRRRPAFTPDPDLVGAHAAVGGSGTSGQQLTGTGTGTGGDDAALDTRGVDADPDGPPIDPTADPATADTRTLEQKRLDALVDIARDSLRGDDGRLAGVDTTAVIHLPLDQNGHITAPWLEGIDAPLSPASALRIAGAAELVATIIDSAGQPLRYGTSRRTFSPAQRRALATRDRGCIWPGCTAPPRGATPHTSHPGPEEDPPTSTTAPSSATTTTADTTKTAGPSTETAVACPGSPHHHTSTPTAPHDAEVDSA